MSNEKVRETPNFGYVTAAKTVVNDTDNYRDL